MTHTFTFTFTHTHTQREKNVWNVCLCRAAVISHIAKSNRWKIKIQEFLKKGGGVWMSISSAWEFEGCQNRKFSILSEQHALQGHTQIRQLTSH